MQHLELLQTCTAFLTLEQVFQLPCFTQNQRTTEPIENPGNFTAGPRRFARIMLRYPSFHLLGNANVAASGGVLEDVDLVHPEVVAGAGFEPATFRL